MAQTVLVTGASTGIGLATAITAARAGWRTVATMRDTSRSSALLAAAAASCAVHGVRVTVIEPGVVPSEFVANVGFDPAGLDAAGPCQPQLRAYLDRTGNAFAAASIVDVLTSAEPAFRVPTSDVARAFSATKLADLGGSAVQSLTAGWIA